MSPLPLSGALRGLRSLSSRELSQLPGILFELLWAPLRLRLQGVGTIRQHLASAPPRDRGPGPPDVPIQNAATRREMNGLAHLVSRVASRLPIRPSCLARSVATGSLIRARFQIPVDLRLGARIAGQDLEAHAWIDVAGEPVGERATIAQDFPPLEPLSPPKHKAP
jgi:Transglutaminase-like superfamily